MATKDGMDLLLEAVEAAGLELQIGDEVTPADFAVQVWLLDREFLEELHAQQFLSHRKSFDYFMTMTTPVPEYNKPSEETLRALERDLNAWFVKKRRGSTCKVFVYPKDDGIWFLVRHGEPFTREPAIQNNESGSILYQPETHDVLVLDPRLGEIRMNADTKGLKELYRTQFGQHLYGDPEFFAGRSKFELDPLRQIGEDSLICEDIPGMEWVKLTEVQIFRGGTYKDIDARRSEDLYASYREQDKELPAGGKITKAKFQIKFSASKAPRTIVISSGNRAQIRRDDDAAIIEKWLGKRGFIVGFKDEVMAEAVVHA